MRSALPTFPRARSASFKSSLREAPATAARATPRMPSVPSVLVPQIFITSLCGLSPPATGHTQRPRTRRQTSTIACAPASPSRDAKWAQRINHLGKPQERKYWAGFHVETAVRVLPRVGRETNRFHQGSFSSQEFRGSRGQVSGRRKAAGFGTAGTERAAKNAGARSARPGKSGPVGRPKLNSGFTARRGPRGIA